MTDVMTDVMQGEKSVITSNLKSKWKKAIEADECASSRQCFNLVYRGEALGKPGSPPSTVPPRGVFRSPAEPQKVGTRLRETRAMGVHEHSGRPQIGPVDP